jgi:hypothetical protein
MARLCVLVSDWSRFFSADHQQIESQLFIARVSIKLVKCLEAAVNEQWLLVCKRAPSEGRMSLNRDAGGVRRPQSRAGRGMPPRGSFRAVFHLSKDYSPNIQEYHS